MKGFLWWSFLTMMKKKLSFKIPISRLEGKSHTLVVTKTAENPTLYCSTYLYSLYKRVPSPPVVDKRVDVVLCGQTVSKVFKRTKCLQCLTKCLTSFIFYQTRSNAIKHGVWTEKMFGRQSWFPFRKRSMPFLTVDAIFVNGRCLF